MKNNSLKLKIILNFALLFYALRFAFLFFLCGWRGVKIWQPKIVRPDGLQFLGQALDILKIKSKDGIKKEFFEKEGILKIL